MPSYTGSGTIVISGCTTYRMYKTLVYKWRPGDTLFLRYRAEKGKLEKIVIKEIKIVSNYEINGRTVFMYKDTFNSLYGDGDLVNEYQALQLAKQYYEKQILITAAAKKSCQVIPQ
jgi:hypothetical protein